MGPVGPDLVQAVQVMASQVLTEKAQLGSVLALLDLAQTVQEQQDHSDLEPVALMVLALDPLAYSA